MKINVDWRRKPRLQLADQLNDATSTKDEISLRMTAIALVRETPLSPVLTNKMIQVPISKALIDLSYNLITYREFVFQELQLERTPW